MSSVQMRQMKQTGREERGERLTALANWTVRIFGGAIFLFLTWYSFRYTQYMNPGGSEAPLNVRDSMSRNLLVLLFAAAAFTALFAAEERMGEKARQAVRKAVLAMAVVWILAAGLWWITSAERMPEGDQAFIYGGASYFREGRYLFLDKGGYCEMYPHQLGLIALVELLFVFVGTYNYFAFQLICVILAAAAALIGGCIVNEIDGHMSVSVIYCVCMMGCFPLIFYTSWVYGDIPSIFCALLAAWMLLRYSRKRHWKYLAVCVAALTAGMLVRKNSLIFLVAFCLVSLVWAVRQGDRKIIAAAGLTILLPALLYAGIYKMYEVRSGFAHTGGLPTLSWISMGLQEQNGKYGWYYDYPRALYYEYDGNANAVEEVVKEDIEERLQVFLSNPSYAWTFFREKILSQWNEPLYQSLYFGTKYPADHDSKESPLAQRVKEEYFTKILWICDRLQFILYFGMLLYFLFAVKRDSNILQHLLAAAIIGGFLFSILWEAKARYVMPYYISMFSLAAVGYFQTISQITMLIGGRRKGKKDNITKFRRAA